MPLTKTFARFFESEKAGGALLVAATVVSLALANTAFGPAYAAFWHIELAGASLEHWINDALMALFFLLVGLELEREIYVGELSDPRAAMLPIAAAAGGMVAPAAIHFALNAGTPWQPGAGIPMATDIAFALAVLSLVARGVPASLKIFLTAFAVMDDLGAVIVIAAAYSTGIAWPFLGAAALVYLALIALNLSNAENLLFYVVGGVLLWYFISRSGVHATIAGVLLAFAIPFRARRGGGESASARLEHHLQRPVAFVVLPLFALANTAIAIPGGWRELAFDPNALGIVAGLLAGKPIGIMLATWLVVATGYAQLPRDMTWRHVLGAGFLGGVGFTMSIFIANLAFAGSPGDVTASKIAIMAGSVLAAVLGFAVLLGARESRGR